MDNLSAEGFIELLDTMPRLVADTGARARLEHVVRELQPVYGHAEWLRPMRRDGALRALWLTVLARLTEREIVSALVAWKGSGRTKALAKAPTPAQFLDAAKTSKGGKVWSGSTWREPTEQEKAERLREFNLLRASIAAQASNEQGTAPGKASASCDHRAGMGGRR